MNINQIRFARAVAESRSFSRAAEQCHISQPSLSSAVAQLERELGGKLFERTTRQVGLTPFGTHLLPLLDGFLGAERELREAAHDWQRSSRRIIRIGFSPAVQLQPVQLALAAYHRDHPATEIVLKECQHDDLQRRLSAGMIDLALTVRSDTKATDAVLLHEEPLMFIPRRPGPGADGRPATFKELSGETFVFTKGCGLADVVRDLFRRARVPIKEYPGQAISYRVVEEWADLGLGAGILPRSKLSGAAGAAATLQHGDGRAATLRTFASWAPGRDKNSPERRFLTWLTARSRAIAAGVAAPATRATSARRARMARS